MMKKLYFFFLFLPLWGLGGLSAWAQSVKLIGEDFDKGEVWFSVTLSSSTPTWVFVEYTTPPHSPADMSRATFAGVTFTPSDAGTTLTGEKRGFLLERSATVTAKLEGVSGMFSWCAYAISAPPRAKVNPDGGYTLHGTPPFTINSNIEVSAGTFGPGTCIESFTDFTYNPHAFLFDPPMTVTATAPATVCAGAVTFTATAGGGTTTGMNYTWSIAGAETTTTTANPYITALDAGVYTCTVFVTNANGCTSTVSEAGTVTVYAVPVVHTVSSATVCYGTAATLTADVSGITTPTYTWVIDGATTTTTTNTYITSALTATTTYTVQITNDDTGCMSEISAVGTVTVPPLPEPKFESAPSAACPNSEVMFAVSGASTDTGGSYCFTYECMDCVRNPFLTGKEVPTAAHCLWNSECVFGTEDTYPVVMPDAGIMTVWVQAKDQYGCTNTASTTVTINTVPAVTAVSSATICSGFTAALSATASNATPQATYTWNIEGYPATTTLTNTYTTPALTATATYTVQITNDIGCASTVSNTGAITVNAVPEVTAVSSATICYGTAAVLTALATDATTPATYTWNIEGYPATTTLTNTYTTPALTAAATYTVQITNDTGCTSTVSDAGAITVNPLPPMPVFLSAPPSTVCPNSVATFTASGAGDGGSYCFTYQCSECLRNPFLTGKDVPPPARCRWDSECEFGAAETYSVIMPDEGSMTVWVQAMNEYGCKSSAATVVAIDKVSISPMATTDTPGTDVTLTASPAGASYVWTPGNDTSQSKTVQVPAAGTTDYYTVEVTTAANCTIEATASVSGAL
jgi:PKD repeat protein